PQPESRHTLFFGFGLGLPIPSMLSDCTQFSGLREPGPRRYCSALHDLPNGLKAPAHSPHRAGAFCRPPAFLSPLKDVMGASPSPRLVGPLPDRPGISNGCCMACE